MRHDKFPFRGKPALVVRRVTTSSTSTTTMEYLDRFFQEFHKQPAKAPKGWSWQTTKPEHLVDFTQVSLLATLAMVLFNPIYWNIVARNEYRNKSLQKVLGSPRNACYFLAVTIFSLGLIRDAIFEYALREQPTHHLLANPAVKIAAAALFIIGQIFVITSIYALGITGTYLGDYCGILMSSRVTGFPFNVLNDPMYVGSAMAFLGTALWYESPAGILVSVVVFTVYQIALRFEGPFTDKIYANKASSSKKTDAVTADTPSTPTKPKLTSRVSGSTYAQAAAEDKGKHGLPSTTPKPPRQVVLQHEGEAPASPMRMTRSRSRARVDED